GRDAKPLQITELAFQPLEGAALPAAAGAEPRVVIDSAGIFWPIQGCRATLHGSASDVPVTVFFLAVGEAIQQQEVQHLVLPGGRGRSERPPRQGGEVEFQQTFLNRLAHRTLQVDQSRIPSSSKFCSRSAMLRYTRYAPAWWSSSSPYPPVK